MRKSAIPLQNDRLWNSILLAFNVIMRYKRYAHSKDILYDHNVSFTVEDMQEMPEIGVAIANQAKYCTRP